jgi:Leucine-rich repeat (LRR) protein
LIAVAIIALATLYFYDSYYKNPSTNTAYDSIIGGREDQDGPNAASDTISKARLDFSSHDLLVFPADVAVIPGLGELDLSNNRISSIPASVGRLSGLRYLDLSDNQLSSLPEEIGGMASLETLDLSNNKLTSLPENIGNLKSLKILDLRGNPINSDAILKLKAQLPDASISN